MNIHCKCTLSFINRVFVLRDAGMLECQKYFMFTFKMFRCGILILSWIDFPEFSFIYLFKDARLLTQIFEIHLTKLEVKSI